MAEIVVAGHICLDIIPEMLNDAPISPGELIEVGAATLCTGGCVANVGRALHRLGVAVRLVGKIGGDPFGDIVRGQLEDENPALAEDLVVSEQGRTSYSIVISPPERDRTFLHMPGENDTFSAADLTNGSLEGARLMHFGYPPLMARMYRDEGRELEILLKKVRSAGVATSLDLSLPDPLSESRRAHWGRILERVLPHVDLFFPSDGELAFMLGLYEKDHDEMTERCLRMGAGVVVIKCGRHGLSARSAGESRVGQIAGLRQPEAWPDRSIGQPCFMADVAGTTGAGDATIAGFLMGFVRGFTFEKCLESACAVGACCVEAQDAVSGVRTWPETAARIAAGWEKA
jgi:sugar/nucleoside kinase (ribokinase family)